MIQFCQGQGIKHCLQHSAACYAVYKTTRTTSGGMNTASLGNTKYMNWMWGGWSLKLLKVLGQVAQKAWGKHSMLRYALHLRSASGGGCVGARLELLSNTGQVFGFSGRWMRNGLESARSRRICFQRIGDCEYRRERLLKDWLWQSKLP